MIVEPPFFISPRNGRTPIATPITSHIERAVNPVGFALPNEYRSHAVRAMRREIVEIDFRQALPVDVISLAHFTPIFSNSSRSICRAGPEMCVRSCSQFSTVRGDTPHSLATGATLLHPFLILKIRNFRPIFKCFPP